MTTRSKPSPGLRSLLSLRRLQGEREGTRDALERLQGAVESGRKSLARATVLPSGEHPEDTRKAGLARAYAEMFDLSDRFNTETEET